jgi:hypothetical protein
MSENNPFICYYCKRPLWPVGISGIFLNYGWDEFKCIICEEHWIYIYGYGYVKKEEFSLNEYYLLFEKWK